jgi:hypothetical protein
VEGQADLREVGHEVLRPVQVARRQSCDRSVPRGAVRASSGRQATTPIRCCIGNRHLANGKRGTMTRSGRPGMLANSQSAAACTGSGRRVGVPLRRAVPQLNLERMLAACKDDDARHVVENVIDGTYIGDNEPWAYDGVRCTFTALRALLAPHAPTRRGRCAACKKLWPCWSWREAFAWIVDYDPVHGRLVDDWSHHTAGDTVSVGLAQNWTTICRAEKNDRGRAGGH